MKIWKEIVALLISFSPAAGALMVYNKLPETVATHFGVNNEVNGTMSKGGLVVVLAVLGLAPLLLRVVRRIDPKRASYKDFSTAFEVTRLGVTLLLAVVGWAMLLYNLGYQMNMGKIAMVIIGLLFAVMGNYLTQVKQNYMFGIRTPWTLADSEVWRKTHRLGGPIMMVGGILSLLAAFFSGTAAVVTFLAIIILMSVIPVVYSYVVFRRSKG